MRLLTAFLVALAATPCAAGISNVGHTFKLYGNRPGTDSVSYTSNAGNCMAVIFVTRTGGSNPTVIASVTDTGGSSYSHHFAVENAIPYHEKIEIWYTDATGSIASSSVTWTTDGNCDDNSAVLEVYVQEYSGATGLGNTATNSGADTAPTVSLDIQDADGWVVGALESLFTITVNSGTQRENHQQGTSGSGSCSGGQTNGVGLDNTATSPSTVTLSGTTGPSVNWCALAFELRYQPAADSPTATVTPTATSSSTPTVTATVTVTPTITPTPPLTEMDGLVSQVLGINDIKRILELDRGGPWADGITQKVFVNQTPQPYWTPNPFRRAVCITNLDPVQPIEYNTGPFVAGNGDCLVAQDKWCVARQCGATNAIWMCVPTGTAEVRLWTQHD